MNTVMTSTFNYDLRVDETGHLTDGSVADLVEWLTGVGRPTVNEQDRTVTAVIAMELAEDPFTAGVQFAQRLDEIACELGSFGLRRGAEWDITPQDGAPWPAGDDVI